MSEFKSIPDLGPNDKRALLFSDAHLGEYGDSEHQDPSKQTPAERAIAEKIRVGEEKFVAGLELARTINGVGHVITTGDMVAGGEKGLRSDTEHKINDFMNLLDTYFPESTSLPKSARHFVPGGHEVGYKLPLSSIPEGGINEESIHLFEGHFNPLFFTFTEGQYLFVALSSDLVLSQGGTDYIQQQREFQREWYKDQISQSLPDQKIVLLVHDPDALAPMSNFLTQYQDRIARTFAGHLHGDLLRDVYPFLKGVAASRLSGPLKPVLNNLFPGKADPFIDYLRENRDNERIWKACKLSIVPAPNGMMGIGGGFLVADFKEDGDVKVHKVKIPAPTK